jgi:alkyl sulfatase BDS1-like metallo-beta-lactamase superfamily hydrolase
VALTDRDERWTLTLRHGVLIHAAGHDDHASTTVTTTLLGLVALVFGEQYAPGAAPPEVTGDRAVLDELLGLLDTFRFWFPLVAPRAVPGHQALKDTVPE